MGEFFAQLKCSAECDSLQVIALDPYFLQLSQYDFETDEYHHKKPLHQSWHQSPVLQDCGHGKEL